MESVLGLVEGKPSRYRYRILQSNGIKFRHYAVDKNGEPTHLTDELVMRPLPGGANAWRSQLKPGDKVIVTLHDGSTRSLKMDSVDGETLRGDGLVLAFTDISSVARKTVDGTKTTLLVIGIIVIGAVASGGGGGGGGGSGSVGGY